MYIGNIHPFSNDNTRFWGINGRGTFIIAVKTQPCRKSESAKQRFTGRINEKQNRLYNILCTYRHINITCVYACCDRSN